MVVNHLIDDRLCRVRFPGTTGRFHILFTLAADVLHQSHADFIGDTQWAHRHACQQTGILDAGRVNTFTQHTDSLVNKGAEHAGSEKATAVVYNDGNLADLLNVIECSRQSLV